MFLDSWTHVGEVLLAALLVYIALIFLLLISGKRSLSKMNSFDFIVTIALGTMVGSTILSKGIALIDGIAGISALLLLQAAVAWTAARYEPFDRLIKSEPRLLFRKGDFLREAMKHERITEDEIRQAVRGQGVDDLSQVLAVILETDGSLSVVHTFTEQQTDAIPSMPVNTDVSDDKA